MRRLVIALVLVLGVSGLVLVFGAPWRTDAGWSKLVSLAHIWIGFFFLVLFPLYAWDHITHNRAWLRRLRGVTLSGAVQTVCGALLMVTGVVLLLYGDQVWPLLRATHHVLTYPLLASIGLHFLSRKS
ncbi:MAG: hypothetical protein HY342_12780 [Candidatus Lambdaproteobacteria bacterium]|nr:hypothetical protein [Candidatus Lambdaproteobacteria bacterium]